MVERRVEIKVRPRRNSFLLTLRNRLVTGIIVALPIVATVTLLSWAIRRIDNAVLTLLPSAAEPQTWFGFQIPGFGVVIAIILLIGLGSLTRNILGRSVIRGVETALLRLPVVSGIYNFVKQIVGVFSRNQDEAFKEVCLIEYPRKGLWAVGFITTDLRGAPADHLADGYACVFVPTTPNPTSGFLLFAKREELTILDMTAEEGAKLIISGGIVSNNEELSDITDEIDGIPSRPSKARRRNPAPSDTGQDAPPVPEET